MAETICSVNAFSSLNFLWEFANQLDLYFGVFGERFSSKCVIESLPQYDVVVPPPMSVLWNKQTVLEQEMGITLRFCAEKKEKRGGWERTGKCAKRRQKRKQNLARQPQFIKVSFQLSSCTCVFFLRYQKIPVLYVFLLGSVSFNSVFCEGVFF